MDFCNVTSCNSVGKPKPLTVISTMSNGYPEVTEDGGTTVRPPAQSKLLAQHWRYQDHLARLVSSLTGAGAPTDFRQLAEFLHQAEEAARYENTKSILG
jgi:hypothetical protein